MPPQTAAIWAGATGAAAVAAGAVAIYVLHPGVLWPAPVPVAVSESAPSRPPPQQPKAPIIAAVTAPAATAPAPTAIKPAFDVVNVEPAGEAVVAGRAAPNAKVELRDAGKMVAEATTDSAGEFVIIPPALSPGGHSLTLATGESPAETSNAIPVAVPEPPPKEVAAAEPSVKPDQPPSQIAAGPAPASAKVAVQSIDAGAGGRLVAKGAAEPNATVRLYLSGAFVGDAKTNGDGRWSLTIEHGMAPGAYELRADQVNPATAAVVARAEAPFDIPASQQGAPAGSVVASADDKATAVVGSPSDLVVDSVQTHHVERGHTLWGISQKYYGDGSRYQIIFAANTNQIRNPNLIYPGQLFVVPKPEPKP